MKRLIPGLLTLLLISSCGNDGGNSKGVLDSDSVPAPDTSAKVLVLPAPLQVATWMKQSVKDPEMNLLAMARRNASNYKTDAAMALNLGVALTDLGYSAMYNQRQDALDHLAIIKKLAADLKLDNVVLSYLPRLEANIEKADSLSALILAVYNDAAKQLNESKREKTALFITAGSYLEGLSVLLNSKQAAASKDYSAYVGQQKLMLNNLADAVTYLPQDDETQDLYNTFFTLQHYYEPVQVKVDGERIITTYDASQITTLRSKSTQLRDEVLNKS
jgi:hypothetical protein